MMKRGLLILVFTVLAKVLVFAQDQAIDYKALLSKLPETIAGYAQEGDPDGSNISMNGLSWSTATRTYQKGERTLTITIIDYKGAMNMYTNFTMVWAGDIHMEDESSIINTVEIDGHRGMETYTKDEQSSTLVLGVLDRYYVTIDADESLEGIRKIAKSLDLSSLVR